jgi:hypothetical protein
MARSRPWAGYGPGMGGRWCHVSRFGAQETGRPSMVTRNPIQVHELKSEANHE